MRSKYDLISELEDFAAEQRALIEAECSGFDTDPVAQEKRIARAKTDFEFFSRTYFPHYIKHEEKSAFHEFAFNELTAAIKKATGIKEAIIAPRGEAKSTIVTQLFSLFCIINELKHMIVIVMDTFEQSIEMLEVIKIELTDNPRLRQDFPNIAQQGRVWQVGVIVTANNIKVKVAGSGKKLRGARHGAHRPDLLILDDLENDENVRSPEQRDKLEKWVNKAALKLGPPDGSMDVLWVGTILHYDSVLNRTAKKPTWKEHRFKAIINWPDRMDLWEEWEEILLNESEEKADQFYIDHKHEMDQGSLVSWPGVRPLVALMKIRADDHHAFDSEMQNDPTNEEESWFANIQYWAKKRPGLIFFGAIDPSLGKKNRKRDPSAILIGGYDRDSASMDVYVAEISRRVPDLIIERSIELQKEFRCMAWAIETVQFQEFMYSELLKRSSQKRVAFPAVPVTPHTDKDLRIQSLSPHVNNGAIRLHISQSTLIEQLTHYPEADHDDGPDALEMLWNLAQQYAAPIEFMSANDLEDDDNEDIW